MDTVMHTRETLKQFPCSWMDCFMLFHVILASYPIVILTWQSRCPKFHMRWNIFSSCESNAYKKSKSIKCLQVIFKLRHSNQMVSILSIFVRITVWFQYRLKGFPHAFTNVLGTEKYPGKKKKERDKSINNCCLFQNTIFYLELESR